MRVLYSVPTDGRLGIGQLKLRARTTAWPLRTISKTSRVSGGSPERTGSATTYFHVSRTVTLQ